eukprot:CAMPEP_0179106480 /NCGR_PEP_ID=MMETSP0796-20121207/49512_1 /TAXON_ID=73915 /ORGANISM="Pyrodinium bahamense, Strain pbaha01" /LENGTH=145 /DNA_ID=CAMNT_0020804513 /DNA_START=44 /DNA_END=481 /DNA_ORIENTATION=+
MAQWSYAPTGRAGCKGQCKEKIPKGAVRLGTELDVGGHTSMVYRRLACVTLKQITNMKEKYGSLEEVPGFADLSAEDQAKVLAQEGVAEQTQKEAEAAKEETKRAKAEAKKKAKEDAKAEKAAAKAAAKAATNAAGSLAKRARTS